MPFIAMELLPGADLEVEGEMVARGLDLRCDVLQVDGGLGM